MARDIDNPSRAGGDRHVCLLGEYLAEHGADVTILCSSGNELARLSHRRGTRIVRFAPLRLLPIAVWGRLLGGAGRRFDLIIEDMIGAARIPFLAPIFPNRSVLGFWFQDNSGFFETHYSQPLAKLALSVQRVVLSVHARCNIVCPSNASRAWLISQGFRADRVGVFYPSADPDDLARAAEPFPSRANRFVSIGNFRRVKRFEQAILTLTRLRELVPDSSLVLIGRGDDSAYLGELRQLARDQGVADLVTFEVGISDARKYEILASSKVLTVHSATEGFALTVTEAGLCGVPSVVNASVPPEAFVPGLTGIRVAQESALEFARAVARLMTDSEAWQALSEGTRSLSLEFKRSSVQPSLAPLLDPFLQR